MKQLKKIQPHYLLMMTCSLVFLVVTAFFEEGVAYFDPVYTTLMSNVEFFLTFSLTIVLFLVVFFLSKKYFSLPTNWVCVLLLFLLFVSDLIGLWCFPEISADKGVYYLSVIYKVRFSLFWLSACLAFYALLVIIPKTVFSVKQLDFYFWGGMIIALSATVYSYITEFGKYVAFFNPETYLPYYQPVVSFTNNRNTYAVLLFIGICCSLYLRWKTQRWWYSLFGFFFYSNVCLTLSRNGFICSTVFLVLYFVWFFIKRFKAHPFITSIEILTMISTLVFLFLIKPIGLASKNAFFINLDSYLSEIFTFSNPLSTSTLGERAAIWEYILIRLLQNPVSLIFGIGDWNFSWWLGACYKGLVPGIESAHSGVFDVFARLGLVGLCFYISLILFFGYLVCENIKHKRSGTWISISIFICVLIHGLFEDTNFLNMQAKDMMLFFMAYVPPLANRHLDNNSEIERNMVSEYVSPKKYKQGSVVDSAQASSLTSLALSLPTTILIGLSLYFEKWNGLSLFGSVFFQISIFTLFLFAPIMVYCVRSFNVKRSFAKKVIYSTASISWCVFNLTFLFFHNGFVSCVFFAAIGFLICCVGLFQSKREKIKTFLLSTISYALLSCVLILISKLVVKYSLVPDQIYQPYAAMCLVLLDIFLIFLTVFVTPLERYMLGFFDLKTNNIEECYKMICYRRQIACEIRLMKSTQRKPLLRDQK